VEVVAKLEKHDEREERHKAQLEEMEDRWKTKVKNVSNFYSSSIVTSFVKVLLISNEKVTEAEERLVGQVEENEALARSNNRLKEEMEGLKERQVVLQEKSDLKEEIRVIVKELVKLQKKIRKQQELITATRKDNEDLTKEMARISAEKEEARWRGLQEKLAETERRAEVLEVELQSRQRVIEQYKVKLAVVEEEQARCQRRAEVVEAAIAAVALPLLVCWWGWSRAR
jgi:hypothetical protein